MQRLTTEQKIYFTLRLAVAMCFIGHGIFGIITKQVWCNYFAVFGIGKDLAYSLMPPLGILDILMGVIILVYPIRALFFWLVIWGTITALLRPLSGEPFAEFIERAGNYGAPLALLALTGLRLHNFKSLFQPATSHFQTDAQSMKSVLWILRIAVFLVFAGHGWLNLIEKKGLIDQYIAVGFANPVKTATLIGYLEIFAAFSILIRPFAPFLLVVFAWKMFSESFYPHYGAFEWIERGGSYGCILALWFLTRSHLSFSGNPSRKNIISPV